MSDPIENQFSSFRRQRQAMANNFCQICGGPTAGNNFLSCPQCFNFDQSFEASQNLDDGDDDNLPPLLNIEPDFRRNRRSG